MSRVINAFLIFWWIDGRGRRMFPLIGAMELLGIILFSLAIIFPLWKIFQKAGHSKWLSVLTVIPFVDLAVLYYVGLAKGSAGQK